MGFRFPTSVKGSLTFWSICSALSLGALWHALEGIEQARASHAALVARRAYLVDLSSAVERLPLEDHPPLDIVQAVAALGVLLRTRQIEDQIDLGLVAPMVNGAAGEGAGGQRNALRESALPEGGTALHQWIRRGWVPGMRSMQLDVQGSYRSLAGLRRYLAAIEGLPVAIRRLKVEGQSFSLRLEVFGMGRDSL